MPADTEQQWVDRVAELERTCLAWQNWYSGIVEDFAGLTTDRNDPDKLHDWEWMDDHRPAPQSITVEVANT